MNKEAVQQKLRAVLQKLGAYKYTALILILGVGLMLLPTGKKSQSQQQPMAAAAESQQDLEQRLEQLLRQVEGAGEVQVLLTLQEGTSYEYQTDTRTAEDENGRELQQETVLLSGGGTQTPVTVRTVYPRYRGAVVLCQGADRAAVRLDMIRAVSSLTGLGSDKIHVIKMKDQ